MRQRCTEALRRFGFCEIAFAVSGTAAEALAAANEALAQTAQTIKSLREELTAMAAFRQELQLGFDRLTLRIVAETAKDLLCATAQTVCLHAVTAAQNTGRLDAMFARFGCAWEWSDPDPVRAGRLQPLAFAPRYTEILAGIQ